MNFILDPNSNMNYRIFKNKKEQIKLQIVPENVDKNKFVNEFLKNNNNVVYRSSNSSSILEICRKNPNIIFVDIYIVFKK